MMQKAFFFTFVVLSLMSPNLLAQSGAADSNVQVGAVAYPGDVTVTDLMIEEIARITAFHPEADVSFSVSIPAVKNERALVGSLQGLPVQSPGNGRITDVSVEVPFVVADFESGGAIEFDTFIDHVNQTLSGLRAESSSTSGKVDYNTQSDSPNEPNCGGYPLNTTVRVTQDMGCLGVVQNTYVCQSNPNTGGRDWYLTSSMWFPPSEAGCFPGTN